MAACTVSFTEDPAAFLERAGAWLARDPVTSTVVSTVAQRMAAAADRGDPPPEAPYGWFAVVTDDVGAVVGTAMRTAPFAPYPLYVLDLPEAGATALADALVDRGEQVGGANGVRPATDTVAARIAERTAASVRLDRHTRLFELGDLVEPRTIPPGRLRPVRLDEAPLATEWYRLFHRDADEQAGREPTHESRTETWTVAQMEDRIRDGVVWFWVDDGDRPVHVTGANPPAYGTARIGPVFTPREHRGRGYASAAVAEVSRILRDQGCRVLLFTDQANPTSNRIYPALGYRPVADMVELLVG